MNARIYKSNNLSTANRYPHRSLRIIINNTFCPLTSALERLNSLKSVQNTQVFEVINVALTGAWSFGSDGSYAGTGGGYHMPDSAAGCSKSTQKLDNRSSNLGDLYSILEKSHLQFQKSHSSFEDSEKFYGIFSHSLVNSVSVMIQREIKAKLIGI